MRHWKCSINGTFNAYSTMEKKLNGGISLPDYILESLEHLVKKLKITFDSIDINLIYDGMFTQVFRISYVTHTQNKPEESTGDEENGPLSVEPRLVKSFIIKMIKRDANLQNEYDIVPAFMREFIFYQRIYPDLARFQKSKSVKSVFHTGAFRIPKCYKMICNESENQYALILQDMRRANYFPLEKDTPADLEQAKAVLSAMGKFHGVSFAYKDQRPNDFAKYEKLIDPLFERISDMEQLITHYLSPRIDEAIEALQPHEEFRREKLRDFKENIYQTFLSYISYEFTDDCCVIGHGDSWFHNTLFKQDDNRVQGACFVDFQLCRYASPILDIVYFIFTSTSAELRNDWYVILLRAYYDGLSETIKKLGSDPETIFSWMTFQQHLKRFGGYGLVMAMLQMEEIVTDEVKEKRISLDEPPARYDLKRRSSIVPVGIVEKIKKTERQERLAGIVRDIVRFGYI